MSALPTLLQTVLAFLLALGSLIIIHELGHYVVARWCGVKVLRFSVGMGKVVYSRKVGPDQTEWAISMLPLGGYVKMLDAREQELGHLPEQELAREFGHQSVWKRMAIVAAGPVANFLLAIALFTGLFMAGIPEPSGRIRVVSEQSAAYKAGLRRDDLVTAVNAQPVQGWSELRLHILQLALDKQPAHLAVERANPDRAGSFSKLEIDLPLGQLSPQDLESDFLSVLGMSVASPKPELADVLPDGAGMRAGLRSGDLVLAVNGKAVLDAQDFVELVRAAPGIALNVQVQRAGEILAIQAVPEAKQVNGIAIGRLEVQMPALQMHTVQSRPLPALLKGANKTWETSVLTLKMLGKMVTGDVSWRNITGPITIADYAGKTSRTSALSYINFIALISISLGVMNLLPIPVLDGGHLLYYSLEVLTGKPVSERFGEIAQRAGVALLVTLMAVAFFNDIVRLMS